MSSFLKTKVIIVAMKRFLDITDFSREGLREALNLMTFMKDNRGFYSTEMNKKTLVSAFWEKDRNSESAFRTAVLRMGGSVIPFESVEGESLKDAVIAMSSYADVIAISHPKKGAARAASLYARVPVINAGDGKRAYPVKTLCDFSSVWIEKNHVSNMKIGFLGDFSDNALVKSLLQCLNLYKGNEFYFISVNGKPVSDDYVNLMDKREKNFTVFDNLFDVIGELDVLYMTPVTSKSFDSEIMFNARKHNFVLDERMLLSAKPDLVILHPFPRGDELDYTVDNDSRAKYFDMFDRYVDACMAAILKTVSGKAGRLIEPDYEESTHDVCCDKEDCITSTEKYLPSLFFETSDGRKICKYCGQELK